MKFGIQHPNFNFDGSGSEVSESLRQLVTTAENLSYDSFWVMDHFHQIEIIGQPKEPILEGWTTIAYLAGVTSRIKLGTLVTGIIYRHPSVLAKIGASLDVLSKGRLFMGVGAAWNDDESKAYGISFPPVDERMQRLEEALEIIHKMWTEDQTTFNGKHYQLKDAICNPKPIQKPHPPIMVGGSGERMTLKLVARYADACNLFGSPQTIRRKLDVLREHCKAFGRNYDSILKTKLSYVMIDEDKQTLKKRIATEFESVSEDMKTEFLISGTPSEVKNHLKELEQAGIECLIVSFEPSRELDAMKLFMEAQ